MVGLHRCTPDTVDSSDVAHLQADCFVSDFELENIAQIIQYVYRVLSFLRRLQYQKTNMIHKIYIFDTILLF